MLKSTPIEKKLLHYTGKAIADFKMIETGDKVMVCLSGGKDSWALLWILRLLQMRTNNKFELVCFTLNQGQPGWDDRLLKQYLMDHDIAHHIINSDTFSIVKKKIPPHKTRCSFCARLRRGLIYRYAKEFNCNKVALGHHRDDLVETLLMSILYSGQIRSMPPKLLTNDKAHIVIRPLAYCQEKDIKTYAGFKQFPIIPCGNCGNPKPTQREKVKALLAKLSKENPKVPSNVLNALGNIRVSQLMDHALWDFKTLKIEKE